MSLTRFYLEKKISAEFWIKRAIFISFGTLIMTKSHYNKAKKGVTINDVSV